MPLHKNIKIIALFNFFTDCRFFVPVIILYFQQVTGSFTAAMSILGMVFIASAVFEVPTGIFSDKVGRKKTLILGATSTFIALVLYATGFSFWTLILGAIFEGLGRSLYSGNNNALLHDTLTETNQEAQYHEFLGKTDSLFQVAAAVAAIVGGYIASISFPLVMWITVIPQIICIVLAFQIIEPKTHHKESGNIFQHLDIAIKQFMTNKKLCWLSMGQIINFGMGISSFEFQAPFYALIWPTWALGVARMIANICGAISFYISGRLINRFSEIRLLFVESIFGPIIKIIVAVFITPLSPAIMACTSILYGIGDVSGNSLQQKEFTNEQRATMESLISLGGGLCTALCSFILGVIADQWGVVNAIIFAQVVLLSINYFYMKVYYHAK